MNKKLPVNLISQKQRDLSISKISLLSVITLFVAFAAFADGIKINKKTNNLPLKDTSLVSPPVISYAHPHQTYHLGTTISTLTPTASGVAAYGFSSSATTIGTGSGGVTIDAAGNVYWGSEGSVKKMSADGSSTVTYASGFGVITGIAVDLQGNMYVSSNPTSGSDKNGTVKKIAAGTSNPVTILSNYGSMDCVAVDAAGNVYAGGNGTVAPLKLPAGGGDEMLIADYLPQPDGIAIDGGGTVYVSSFFNRGVYKVPPHQAQVYVASLLNPTGLAVSGGNLYVASGRREDGQTVKMIAPGSSSPVIVASGFTDPWGVTFDPKGNLIVTEQNSGPVRKISPVGGYFISPELPAGLSFDRTTGAISGTPTAGSPATDYTITAYNAGGSTSTTVNLEVVISNADLSNLAVNSSSISPSFSASQTNYQVSVPNTTTNINIYATAVYAASTIKINGNPATNGSASVVVPLAEGWNKIAVEVTAPDGVTTKTYTITVKRAKPYPKLTDLSISSGTLVPTFPGASNYTVSVPNPVSSVKVTATSTDTIKINGNPVRSGTPSADIPLTLGSNYIAILVTRRDTTLSTSYSITVTRLPALPTVNYAEPQMYHLGKTIPTLKPVSTNVAAYGFSSSAATIGTGSGGVATDAADNVYWGSDGSIKKMTADGSSTVTFASGFGSIRSIAIDRQGNMYVADNVAAGTGYSGSVKKIAAGSSTAVTIYSIPTSSVDGVATDAAGNVYVVGDGMASVVVIPADGSPNRAITGSFNDADGVAVDGAGNVYVASFNNNNITKIPAGGYDPILIIGSLKNPTGLAISGGNLYIADRQNRLVKMREPGGLWVTVASGFNAPWGVALDHSGNLIVTEQSNGPVRKLSPVGGYFISPELPGGLSLNKTTGAISGTPTTSGPATNYTITAYNTGGTATATVNMGVIGDNADLSTLTVNPGSLSPAFYPSVNSYTVTYPNGATSISISPWALDAAATIKINGTPVVNGGSSAALPLNGGKNTFVIEVTAPNHVTTKTYTITANKFVTPPVLTALSTSTGTISPAFSAATLNYTTSVPNSVSDIRVTAASNDTIKVNGTPIVSGTASANIPLTEGSNTITVLVTRRDTAVSQAYTIAVTRLPVAPVVHYAGAQTYHLGTAVSALTPTSSRVAPYGFSSSATTIGVGGDGVVTDAAGNVYWSFEKVIKKRAVDGNVTTFATGFSAPSRMTIDRNGNIYVLDDETPDIERVTGTIEKIPAGSSTPTAVYSSSIWQTGGSLATDVKGNVYFVTEDGINVLPADGSRNIYTYNKSPQNLISIAVDATGNIYASNYYNRTIYKIPAGSDTPVLIGGYPDEARGFTISGGNLYFVENQTGRVKMMEPGASPVVVARGFSFPETVALDRSGNLIVAAGGETDLKMVSPVGGYFVYPELPGGLNFDSKTGVISGTPTAGSPATDYTITAYNSGGSGTTTVNIAVVANNANLSGLALSAGTLSPAFSASVTGYTVSYPNSTKTINIRPTAVDAASTIKINGTTIASGSLSAALPLAEGWNTFTIAVTASDQVTTKTYTIRANRSIPPPVLTALTTSTGTLSPAFSATTLNYNTSVPNSVSNIKVTATSTDTIKVNGTPVVSGTATANILLTEGGNTITVLVTRRDTAVSQAYTIAVTRLPAVPVVHYAGPQTYRLGTAISTLTPTASGVAAYGFSSTATSIGLGYGGGVVTDAAGNIYWAYGGIIKKMMADGSTVTFASGFYSIKSLVIDLHGNMYVADNFPINDEEITGTVKKIPAGSSTSSTVYVTDRSSIGGLATDATGNVYVVSENWGSVAVIPADGSPNRELKGQVIQPYGLALDAMGNVYVSGFYDRVIYTIPAGGGTPHPVADVNDATGLTFSGGNLYFTERQLGVIKMIAPGASPVIVASGFKDPEGAALDRNGNLIVVGGSSGDVKKISPVGGYFIYPELPAGLSFNRTTGTISGTPTISSPATDYTITAYNTGGGGTTTVNIAVTTANVDLANLVINPGQLTPAFNPAAIDYTTAQTTSAAVINVKPVKADASEVVTVNGTGLSATTGAVDVPLAMGQNTITILVKSSDNSATKTYTLKVTRQGAPSLSYGNPLVFYSGTPAQYLPTSSNVIAYSISPALPAGLSIDPQSGIISGTATSFSAAANYVVTATNDAGSTAVTVNISVLQAAANNTILSSLSLSTRTALTKVDGPAMVNYVSNVSAATTSLSVIPTTTDQDATITVNGVTVASGTASDPITLNTSGSTVINMVVTARDGITTKTYSITINRTASSNAFLAHLALSSGTTLNYAAGTSDMNYNTNVGNINSLTVTPTTSDANATVTVNGTPVTSGTATGAITLNAVGSTVINLLVTAQDGITTKSYSITVNRQRSSNARLKGFYLSTKPFLSLTSGTATFNYATTVDVNTAKITVTPTLADLNAKVTVNGKPVASGAASDSITLNAPASGPTIINMLVTAEDGITTSTYSVAVTRSVSSNANLTGIYILPYYALTYGEKNVLSASVPDTLSSVRVNASVVQGASVRVNGIAVASGTPSAPVTLGAGITSISVVVTAPDSITTKTYTIVLSKSTAHFVAAKYNARSLADAVVNPALSPNGDGINDHLTIDNITSYPDNKITIMDVSGTAIYTQKGYDNASVVFDGHANNGKMQKPGTYYYLLEYKAGNENRRKTGYIIIKN